MLLPDDIHIHHDNSSFHVMCETVDKWLETADGRVTWNCCGLRRLIPMAVIQNCLSRINDADVRSMPYACHSPNRINEIRWEQCQSIEWFDVGRRSMFGNPVKPKHVCPVCGEIHASKRDTHKCYELHLRTELANSDHMKRVLLDLTRRNDVLLSCPGCELWSSGCHARVIERVGQELLDEINESGDTGSEPPATGSSDPQ